MIPLSLGRNSVELCQKGQRVRALVELGRFPSNDLEIATPLLWRWSWDGTSGPRTRNARAQSWQVSTGYVTWWSWLVMSAAGGQQRTHYTVLWLLNPVHFIGDMNLIIYCTVFGFLISAIASISLAELLKGSWGVKKKVCFPSLFSFPPATSPASAIEFGSCVRPTLWKMNCFHLQGIITKFISVGEIFFLLECPWKARIIPQFSIFMFTDFKSCFEASTVNNNATKPHSWILLPVDFGISSSTGSRTSRCIVPFSSLSHWLRCRTIFVAHLGMSVSKLHFLHVWHRGIVVQILSSPSWRHQCPEVR